MRQGLDVGIIDGDDEGRGVSIAIGAKKLGIVGGDNQANDEGAKNVEENDTDVNLIDCLGDVAPRIASFTSGNSNDFSTNEGL
jgi:hypothetical protein